MKRRLLFASAGVIALLVVMSALGSQPAARADDSSMDWDVEMTDAKPTGADPVVCPSQLASAGDGNIDVGECPEIDSHFLIDTANPASNESFFDLATQIWKTGPPADSDKNGLEDGTGPVTPGTGDCLDGADNDTDTLVDSADPQCVPYFDDLDGDTLPDPSGGVAQFSNLTHATTVGVVSFSVENNLVLGNVFSNNIDDTAAGNYDTTVLGQPAVCGSNQPGPTGTFSPAPNYIWSSTTSSVNLVPYNDTTVPKNG